MKFEGTLCACMGPSAGDQYCPCLMRMHGLVPTPSPPPYINHAAIQMLKEREEAMRKAAE